MRTRLIGAALAAGVALAACGGSDDGPLDDLGEAACADLRDGVDMQAMANTALRQDGGLSKRQIASSILLGVEDHCPEFQDEFDNSLLPGWITGD